MKNMLYRNTGLGLFAKSIVMLLFCGISAQATETVATMDSVAVLDEVSITAIKTTRAGSFPVSLTSLSERQIEAYDIAGLKGVSEIAPNFYMPQYGSRMTSSIYVRGLGTRIDQPVVALNVDNVQLLNKDSYDFNFPDIDRIEVVRGPQGILYGRNSMGGVINITTISPLHYKGFRAVAEYGSGNTWRAAASAYLRPSETLGIALTASMNSTDGFFRNQYSGQKVDKERQGLGRVKLSWRPSSRFTLENSAWATITRQGGYPYESLQTGQINHNDTCFYRRTNLIDGLTMRYFGDKVSVSSITSVQYLNDNMTLDQDFLPQDYFVMTQRRHEWALSQDFVVKGATGSYNYLFGAYGFYRRTNMSAPVTFLDYGLTHLIESGIASKLPAGMSLEWDNRSMTLASDFLTPVWGYALYHKSEYSFGRFTASVGLRLAFERTDFRYNSYIPEGTTATMYREVTIPGVGTQKVPLANSPIELDHPGSLHMTSLQLLPEFKLAYTPATGITIGASVSKGYKSGGYNTQMFSDILQQMMMEKYGHVPMTYNTEDIVKYKPEYSWNYELDFSVNLPSAGLTAEASVFYIDCRDQQMTMFPDGVTTGRVMANAGRTRSVGMELSANWTPSPEITLHGAYGLADARFRSFNNGIADCRGNHVPYAPENTLFGSVSYRADLRGCYLKSVVPMITYRGIGRIYWNETNTASQRFYNLLGASVTLSMPHLDIDLWGENLGGARYHTFYFESIGNGFVQRGNPRRFGVTLRTEI